MIYRNHERDMFLNTVRGSLGWFGVGGVDKGTVMKKMLQLVCNVCCREEIIKFKKIQTADIILHYE